MENTLENKQRFFAQYVGQEVYVWHTNEKDTVNDKTLFYNAVNGILELTPLSMISDEDAIEVAKLDSEDIRFNTPEFGKEIALLSDWKLKYFIVDYLRSKGYALPFMGLSVEQQIEYGWVKLKK